MTEVEIVLDSINAYTNNRITTLRCVFPRIILAELVTHRLLFVDDTHGLDELLGALDADTPHLLSKNSASSRAIPISRMIRKVEENPYIPKFRTGMKGMTSGSAVADKVQEIAQERVQNAMQVMLGLAEYLFSLGIEKGQANRYLEPFAYVEVLITATEWNNFLMLRDHPAAMGEMQELAKAIRGAMESSKPQVLYPGEWHLPYVSGYVSEHYAMQSAACCARVSYKSLATGLTSTYAEDMVLFDKLTGGNPKHLSPTEHQALATSEHVRYGNFVGWMSLRKKMFAGEEKGGDLVGL